MFVDHAIYQIDFNSSSMTLGDINEDKKSDIIIANEYSHNRDLFYNIGNGRHVPFKWWAQLKTFCAHSSNRRC
jgi:hypothetical protein